MRAWSRTVSSAPVDGRPPATNGADVEDCRREDAEGQAADDDAELLLEQDVGGPSRAGRQEGQRDEGEHREMEELEALEGVLGAEDGRLGERPGERQVHPEAGQEEEPGRRIEGQGEAGMVLEEPVAQREDHEEVEEEGREGQEGDLVERIEDRVEGRHLPGRREDHERGEGQRQEIEEDVGEGHQSPRVEIDDQPDAQRHQANEDEVIVDGIGRLPLGIEGRVDLHALFVDVVADALVGRRGLPEALEDVALRPHRDLVDGGEDVPLADAGPQEGLARGVDEDGPKAFARGLPGDAVRDVPPLDLPGDVHRAQDQDGQERHEDEGQRFLHRYPKN